MKNESTQNDHDSEIFEAIYERILGLEDVQPPTLSEWESKDVENSPIAFMNRFLNDGPLEDFDRFVLKHQIRPEEVEDQYSNTHREKPFPPIIWSLLLKEARNLPSDEKLEFYLKANENIAQLAGFDDSDDVPRNTTFWRAYASDSPRIDEEMMEQLKIEARKIVHHAKYVGFELPERAEEHLTEFGKGDLMNDAEEIAQRLLIKTLPHIAFDRDQSRTTYSLPSFAGLLAHLALESAFPENGSETFDHMDIYENGGTGADNFYHFVKKRDAEEWFDRFLRANEELLKEARNIGYFQNASETGFDTTGIPWYGNKNNNFVDGTKPSRNYSYAFHFSTVGIVGEEASLSLAAHHLKNRSNQDRIIRKLMQRVQDLHYFSENQLDVNIERAYLDKGFYGSNHITALRESDIEFIIKARKVDPIKDVIDKLEEWDVDWGILKDYEIGGLKQGTNIFIRPSEKRAPRYNENADEEDKKYGRWVAFVTDIDPVTADRERLARQFRNRWGVETQYRQFKHKFYAPTKSSKGRIRAFHFNLAQLFYNIWVVVNLELRDRYGLVEQRPVTADDVLHAIRDEAFGLDDLPE